MVNASLLQGRLPDSQKHAIVTSILKKPGLDTADMNNYRPVPNLSFMSKLIERVVAKQLHEYLSANNLIPRFQSASGKSHSTETVLLRVSSDMLMAANDRKVTLLSLFDVAAFDCVDHLILLKRLQVAVGIAGTGLDWIQSFLSGRTQ
jgi:Reverse transcriptase (RNA-dependent DNA polymerase)